VISLPPPKGRRLQETNEVTHAFARRSILIILALGAPLLALAGAASAATASQYLPLTYHVSGLPAGSRLDVVYSNGVNEAVDGNAQAVQGSIQTAAFTPNNVVLISSAGQSLTAYLTQGLMVGSAPVTGWAIIPAGTTVTAKNFLTGQQTALINGPFSIPTGVGHLGARAPSGGRRVVQCRGGRRSCQASLSIARGASNRRITIRLTHSDLWLRSIKAYPKASTAAYALSGRHFTVAGSEYVVTLNAARSNPRGSHLTLSFRSP
jgi:hypothetical protein